MDVPKLEKKGQPKFTIFVAEEEAAAERHPRRYN